MNPDQPQLIAAAEQEPHTLAEVIRTLARSEHVFKSGYAMGFGDGSAAASQAVADLFDGHATAKVGSVRIAE